MVPSPLSVALPCIGGETLVTVIRSPSGSESLALTLIVTGSVGGVVAVSLTAMGAWLIRKAEKLLLEPLALTTSTSLSASMLTSAIAWACWVVIWLIGELNEPVPSPLYQLSWFIDIM